MSAYPVAPAAYPEAAGRVARAVLWLPLLVVRVVLWIAMVWIGAAAVGHVMMGDWIAAFLLGVVSGLIYLARRWLR
jgi:hypothetical protein